MNVAARNSFLPFFLSFIPSFLPSFLPFFLSSVSDTQHRERSTACLKATCHTSTKLATTKHDAPQQNWPNKSAKSGTAPSTPSKASACEEINEPANARLHKMDNMRVHLRRHPRNHERLKSGAASRARPDAKHSMKFNASTLHRPPVSSPTTTNWHLPPSNSSWYLFSLSTRASELHHSLWKSWDKLHRTMWQLI